jgi:hypothetical protein
MWPELPVPGHRSGFLHAVACRNQLVNNQISLAANEISTDSVPQQFKTTYPHRFIHRTTMRTQQLRHDTTIRQYTEQIATSVQGSSANQ